MPRDDHVLKDMSGSYNCSRDDHRFSSNTVSIFPHNTCSFGWWLVLICSERKVMLAGCWRLISSERKSTDGWWLISCHVTSVVMLCGNAP
jgi:hypothetical protein